MRNASHRFWPCIAAAVAVSVIAVPAASAGVVKYDTSLKSGHTEHCCYHGRVASKVSKCERGRRVVLYKQQPGADRKVDHDRTGKDRWWSFAKRGTGDFYAKATRERHKGFVCLAARAPTVNFGSE
jgi:hypothetical protein